MNDEREELLKRYDKLPENVREVMFAEASADKIEELGKKYGFLIDKIGKLADEVGYFMLGMTNPRDFPRQLMRELDIPESKANEIVGELNNSIFKPIREQLAQLHGGDESEFESSSSFVSQPPPTPPPQPAVPPSFAAPPTVPSGPPIAPMIFPEKMSAPAPAAQISPKKEIPKAPPYVPDQQTTKPVPPVCIKPEASVPQKIDTPIAKIEPTPQPTAPVIETTPPAPPPKPAFNPGDPYHESLHL